MVKFQPRPSPQPQASPFCIHKIRLSPYRSKPRPLTFFIYASTSLGTSVRLLYPPNADPFHTRPETNNRGTHTTSNQWEWSKKMVRLPEEGRRAFISQDKGKEKRVEKKVGKRVNQMNCSPITDKKWSWGHAASHAALPEVCFFC